MPVDARWGGLRPEPYDPDARDADNDGIVQEGTAWERPAGTHLLDQFGRAISRMRTANERPAGLQVIGADGNPVDYTPTYVRNPALLAPGGSPINRAGLGPTLKDVGMDLGVPSLKDQGLPTVGDIVTGATPAAATPQAPGVPEAPTNRPRVLVPDNPDLYGRGFQDDGVRRWMREVGVDFSGTPMDPDDPAIPDTLYHVTIAGPALRESGTLEARASGGGLGGSATDAAVSLTTNEEVALQLAEDLRLLGRIREAHGEPPPIEWDPDSKTWRGAAERAAWAQGPYQMLRAEAERDGWEFTLKDFQLETTSLNGLQTEYFSARRRHTGRRNPIIFGADQQTYDPADVEVLEIPKDSVRTGALITDFDLGQGGGLDEIRVYGDVPLGEARVLDENSSIGVSDATSALTMGTPGSGKTSAVIAGITADTVADLPEPKRPYEPRPPSPPPLGGTAQRLADRAQSYPEFAALLDEAGFVALDYETTGLDNRNIPTQIGAVRVQDGVVVERFNVFTNPEWPLSDWSKENLRDADGNPLTDEWLATQTNLADAHRALTEFIGEDMVLAHNYPFDGEILTRMLDEAGIDWAPSGTIDSAELLRQAVPRGTEDTPGPAKHTLSALAEFFDVPLGDDAHAADADADAAALVLMRGLRFAQDREPVALSEEAQAQRYAERLAKYDDDVDSYPGRVAAFEKAHQTWERAVTRGIEPGPEPEAPLPSGADLPKMTPTQSSTGNFEHFDRMRNFVETTVFNERHAPWRSASFTDVDGNEHTISRRPPEIEVEAKMLVAHDIGTRLRADVSDDQVRAALEHITGSSTISMKPDGTLTGFRDGIEVARDDPTHGQLAAEHLASVLVNRWAKSSNDEDALSLAIQQSAERLFSLEDTEEWFSAADPTAHDEITPVIDAFVAAQYRNTQKHLAEQGITEVVLHRGMSLDRPNGWDSALAETILDTEVPEGELGNEFVRLRPLSSFSYDIGTTDGFRTDNGAVLSATVPAERIFSTAATGSGCFHEEEFVVLGGGDTKFHVAWEMDYLRDEGRVWADGEAKALTDKAPKWLTDGYSFTSEYQEDETWDLVLHNIHTGTSIRLDNSSSEYNADFTPDLVLPGKHVNQWTDADWEETFGALDRNPEVNVKAGTAAVQGALPEYWDSTEGTMPGTLRVALNSATFNEINVGALLDPKDLTRYDENALATEVARIQAHGVAVGVSIGFMRPLSGRVSKDPALGTGIIEYPVHGVDGGVENFLRIRSTVTPGLTPDVMALPGLDGGLSVERYVDGNWQTLFAVPQEDIYRSPTALNQATEAILAELRTVDPDLLADTAAPPVVSNAVPMM